ncbi:MAG: GGDEF domain-containing protein [Aquincola tertiaricarbonis]|uniref:GGDEF domain-containing protein n=1 Tax=Aquincola sp. J276 TaxID=2898432 RepID=UPI0021508488|nr:GGDEF domain-containing protein [Aquincola sp. J276]MCR5864178.1 GGDEF domain-containing protein [Aquincola sp. J276]
MRNAIDHLGRLTELRDRDLLDLSLLQSIRDLVRPDALAIHRVAEGQPARWSSRLRLQSAVTDGAVAHAADAVPLVEFDDLPALDEHLLRARCLHTGERQRSAGPPAWSGFPMLAGERVEAVLELHTRYPLTRQESALVSGILQVFGNFRALLDYSERDTLTGLLNRKSFDTAFFKLLAEGTGAGPAGPDRRRGDAGPVHWLGVIDIDHFKRVNDRFGHLIGDEVLLLVARLMNTSFRASDRLYRFGGEEFVVLLRGATEAEALQAFDRFRAAVADYPMPQVGRITVSAGVTRLRPGDTPSAAFERADRATYHAKNHGRDQVWSHEALVRDGNLQDDDKSGVVVLF